jgi:hypothetical protein
MVSACASQPVLIDEDPSTGFAIYRSGRLSSKGLEELCRQGVEEMVVLSGTGMERECLHLEGPCADLWVRFDTPQQAERPVSEEFLKAFDAWVEEARSSGRRIAFRCRHGWHRTGRLAAYYQMKYQGASVDEAKATMHRIGRMMWLHPYLDPQVEALSDYLEGRPCSTARQHCVEVWTAGDRRPTPFPKDACSRPPS